MNDALNCPTCGTQMERWEKSYICKGCTTIIGDSFAATAKEWQIELDAKLLDNSIPRGPRGMIGKPKGKPKRGLIPPDLTEADMLTLMYALQHLQLAEAGAESIRKRHRGYKTFGWIDDLVTSARRVLRAFTGQLPEDMKETFLDLNAPLWEITRLYREAGPENQQKMLALLQMFVEGKVFEVEDEDLPES